MRMMAEDEQEKSQLATEICELSARANACANLHHPRVKKSTFINWYLVLRVDENADMCVVKKQYHKLALKLHPDKNKHSKAETAFKLVSEAYFCLSDRERRAAFDSQRKIFSCIKCNIIPSLNNTNVKIQMPNQETFSRSNQINKRMKNLRDKLKEEAIIIEKCLTANAAMASTRGFRIRSEIPIFNPSDYQYKGYGYGCPQHRSTNQTRLDNLRAAFKTGNMFMQNKASNSSPVFQYRSEIASSVSKYG